MRSLCCAARMHKLTGIGDATFFARWFDKLVQNQLGAFAVCLTGLAIGFFLVNSTRFVPEPYDKDVGHTGVVLMQVSTGVFCVTMIVYCMIWLWNKNRAGYEGGARRARRPRSAAHE